MLKIMKGDNLERIKELEDNSIDSIVTDPPYGISFMGKKWDYDVPGVAIWKECLRVLKPGGYLLSFAGTRTQHRMAVNIEDAGFEIRDMIAWVYGSGFPKSHNIGKAVDKKGGKDISWFGKWLKNWRTENNLKQSDISKLFPSKTGGLTGCVANWELGLNIPTNEQFNLICKTFNLPFDNLEEAEREIIGKKKSSLGGTVAAGERCQTFINKHKEKKIEITKGNSPYEGWGTALKPALEPITVARKPFKGTVANNVLKYGTGGINIDSSRIGATEDAQGRFPANFIHDGSEEVVDLLQDSARYFYCAKCSKKDRNEGLEEFEEKQIELVGQLPDGFISSYGNVRNRPLPKKNFHPTVKPTALMQYLVRLVTPVDGIVLDPFMGSGSTGKACVYESFNFIGMEMDEEYCKIAEARIKFAKANR
jgi:DNA modification methylase